MINPEHLSEIPTPAEIARELREGAEFTGNSVDEFEWDGVRGADAVISIYWAWLSISHRNALAAEWERCREKYASDRLPPGAPGFPLIAAWEAECEAASDLLGDPK